MTDNEFWSIVEQANIDLERFGLALSELEQDDLKSFVWRFDELAGDLTEDVYIDCILENRERISDDGLEDLCGWIVGKGPGFYGSVIANPEKIPAEIDDDAPGILIQYEAARVYERRFHSPVPES